MTLDEQRAICARYAEEAFYGLFAFMRANKQQIIADMDAGLVGGFDQRIWS